MISYELAKELKDAGFPLNGGKGGFITKNSEQIKEGDKDLIYYTPTLSELIEACRNFKKIIGFQLIIGCEDSNDCSIMEYSGKVHPKYSSPEEVVARLWLALNKHD